MFRTTQERNGPIYAWSDRVSKRAAGGEEPVGKEGQHVH